MAGVFMKGEWKAGLFEPKCPLCLWNYCCDPCSVAQIHEKVGNPSCGKPIACIAACCGAGGIQLMWYGTLHMKEKEPMQCAFLKCWCCGICYLHQQYKEHGCVEGIGPMAMTSFKPSQSEMS